MIKSLNPLLKYAKVVKTATMIVLIILAIYFVYQAGVDSCRADNAKAISNEVVKDGAKVNKVIKYREKLKVVYRDKIKYIQSAKDATGCADTKLVDMGFGLHK